MKKIIYGIALFCLMFIGTVNVYAAGSVDVSATSLNVKKDGTATFNIVTVNATARANIVVDNSDVVTIDFGAYNSSGSLKSSGEFISAMEGKGKTIEYTITVKAVGNVGDTATVTVEVFDASTFDIPVVELASTSNKMVKTIAVTVVDESAEPVTPTTEYTIKYDANNGTGAPAEHKKVAGEEATLSSQKPTREGYEFNGWNTKADGTGTVYSVGGKYNVDENLTLYAQWKQTGNVTTNPKTGDTLIYVILLLTLGGLIYSYWYMKKAQEN